MLLSKDPLTALSFSIYENKGVFAVLLGSGLSRSASIPTGWEITVDLIRRIGLAQGAQEQADWGTWYRAQTGEEPNYSTILEDLALSPDERRSILHSYIEPTPEDREAGRKVPTRAHLAIADMVRAGYIRVIVTTNFDRLMENALRERGVEPTVVASADALAGSEPITHSTCYILKLHGDYKDARILNTNTELSAYPNEYDRLLDRIFDEHGLIVAGWSGEWDHALRSAVLRAPNRRYPVYWAARDERVGDGAQELVAHRRARVVPIADADSFFSGIRDRIDTLAQSQRENPLSIDLLVSSTKRYLSRLEYRIQLDELLAAEAHRLVSQLDSPDLGAQPNWSPAEFRQRVSKYEAMTEPLARMAGVLGRWGDGTELQLVLDLLRALYREAEKIGNGLTVWLHLRSYPAVLLFTAYGIGLTRARRWETLHDLFSGAIAREGRELQRVVDTLFLWDWKGGDNDLWTKLDGLDRRKTALSDHLLKIFDDWGRSFYGLTPEFEILFERFEVLASLAHLESTTQADLETTFASTHQNSMIRMPVGRVGWNSSSRDQLIQELGSEKTRNALVSAGFARGSEAFLDLFFVNLRQIAGRMSW